MSLERSLIEHCSPTLANLKVGSLFCFLSPASDALLREIEALNAQLQPKGLALRILRSTDDRTLCYLYRLSQLSQMIRQPEHAAFLRDHGYPLRNSKEMIDCLCNRVLHSDAFPHEIGLFLGYPLGDVIGFIENNGKNCLCCGCWKAYTNACAAKKRFDQFAKCTQVYRRLYLAGRSLSRLTVAA